MKIGVDISSLQGLHRMRGIGYVTSHFINNIDPLSPNKFVFYLYGNTKVGYDKDILKDIKLNHDCYEVRYMSPSKTIKLTTELPGKLKYLKKAFTKFLTMLSYARGSKKFGNVSDLDAFIQLDQSEPLARLHRGAKNYFVAYDLIPYVLESDYLWNYRTARSNGKKRLGAIKHSVKRSIYIWKIKINSQKAHKIIAISNTTKQDFIRILKAPAEKIEVVRLGLDNLVKQDKKIGGEGIVNRYHYTSWGYVTKKGSLKDKRFLLFVGGVDPRRKLEDVVTAFNHLRAQGEDIKLVLSGDVMKGPLVIDTIPVRNALLDSSYSDDIYFLGFTDDKTRDWLYDNALAFMFPSIYEGFGLPVLEAMQYHTPVIAYDNSAVKEIAENLPIYANDPLSIIDAVRCVMALGPKELQKLTDKAFSHSSRYKWKKSTESILNIVSK